MDKKTVFMIKNKVTGKHEGVYSRSYGDEFEFDSKESALHANCHGIHRDTEIYEVEEYEVTYKKIVR